MTEPRESAAVGAAEWTVIDAALEVRARKFAQAPVAERRGATEDVLVCRLGTECYAIPSRYLRGVQQPKRLTPVPCAPAYVAGLLNISGEIVTIMDLAVALGLRTEPHPTQQRYDVLLVEMPARRVGLLVDEVVGMSSLDLETLERGLFGARDISGVSGARTMLLDLTMLLGDRFEVNDTVGAP